MKKQKGGGAEAGLRLPSRKRLASKDVRGFESHPLRHVFALGKEKVVDNKPEIDPCNECGFPSREPVCGPCTDHREDLPGIPIERSKETDLVGDA